MKRVLCLFDASFLFVSSIEDLGLCINEPKDWVSVITHGRRMEYHRSHSMFLTHEFAGTVGTSWSDRASLPRKRARAGNAISHRIKNLKAKQDGGRKNRSNSGEALLTGLLSDSHRTQNTKPTSAPTSTRDEPHVGTHICGETPYTLRSTLFRISRTFSEALVWWFGSVFPKYLSFLQPLCLFKG